jgi:hypothetical protein
MTSEPTPEMIAAARTQLARTTGKRLTNATIARMYTAMRSSLPNPEGMTEALERKIGDVLAQYAGAFYIDCGDAEPGMLERSARTLARYVVEALSTRSEGQVTEAQRVHVADAIFHACQPFARAGCDAVPMWSSGQEKIWLTIADAAIAALSSTTRVGADAAHGCEVCDGEDECTCRSAPDEDAELARQFAEMLHHADGLSLKPTAPNQVETTQITTRESQLLQQFLNRIAERISSRDDGLRPLLKRVTDAAENLAGELHDPGTEALAAIHCARAALGARE